MHPLDTRLPSHAPSFLERHQTHVFEAGVLLVLTGRQRPLKLTMRLPGTKLRLV